MSIMRTACHKERELVAICRWNAARLHRFRAQNCNYRTCCGPQSGFEGLNARDRPVLCPTRRPALPQHAAGLTQRTTHPAAASSHSHGHGAGGGGQR